MSDMDSYKVLLDGPAPWGFRLQGGKDFNMPLSISRLTPGGKAAQAGVGVGDWVLSIDGENTSTLTHIEAQNKIRACGDKLSLSLSRVQNLLGKPQKDSLPSSEPLKYNFAPSNALNKTARPFGVTSAPNSQPGLVTKPVPYTPPASICTAQHNGHSLRLVSLPAFLPNDSSKKRLIEDTEDWRPRTGTTQSRSFRILAHLTGTEFMQDPDEDHIRKASQVSIPDLSSAPTLKVEPGYGSAAPKPAPISGPVSRPPWAVDPSFAERYAPDKTSTVLSKHSQPATPTPMQNRNSIVQAAQQAPESGNKTPICCQCSKIIRGRYLVALGRYYHPEEFTCSQCRKVLDEGGFFEEKGSIFCPKCYDMRYAPNCAKCKKKITGEIMHALKTTWHVQCFICAACKTPIRNRAFYMEEGQPYCERDYEKMFGTKCRGCDFKIDAGDRFLEALGFSWHDTCFVCAICQINLEGKTFYSKKDKPLCKSHAFSHV
ncbi:PDZ and LIM domain protein 7 isoform X1 [Hemicordylus capensis]|uniref:PDZ and LIM domain protein 7 isoform X1 n=1 Tax=Hemicordylus capensis TaxID=884348 RepID=UPI002303DC25|nr:PDZ and LIM domain protein 7 isoform X1 [Hemicordylus capensis]XP_053149883.1 PDZ and LIM domain protein 7 isoform X1 [Hemicordylus capensis]